MKSGFPAALDVIDLSHTLSSGMPFFPGTEEPVFAKPFTVARNGFSEQRITMLTHCGTHMDAPAHIFEDGPTLEQLGLPHFIGSAATVDLSGLSARVIGMEDLRPSQHRLSGKDFVLLRTGWSAHWGHPSYYRDYPFLSEEAALWLAGFALKGIGTDTISFDAHDSTTLPVHRIFLSRNTVLIENLANLDSVAARDFLFCCLPLKIADTDGAPVRAVALREKRRSARFRQWLQAARRAASGDRPR
jgi:kynurenine formamidase